MPKDPSFSLVDFKNWVQKHHNESSICLIDDDKLKPGDQVLIYLSEKNMMNKLYPINSNRSKKEMKLMCEKIKENGALLKEINGANALVQVLGSNENIIVQRLFLRRPKKK